MKTRLVRIGNSRGIRIPKPLIEEAGQIRKTRPCVVVSPDELNAHLRTFIVAPLTTVGRSLGRLSPATMARVLAALQEMFAP